jgi:hypothetical protein
MKHVGQQGCVARIEVPPSGADRKENRDVKSVDRCRAGATNDVLARVTTIAQPSLVIDGDPHLH